MKDQLLHLPEKAQEVEKETKKYFQRLKKRPPKSLDLVVQDLHAKTFSETDCLACANCCKTTSPLFTPKDIHRISKHLRMKQVDFTRQYLEQDSDDFYVLKSVPCVFLDAEDNTCLVYEVRPKACREYPHTDRKKFIQITDLTTKNATICPAVFSIVEKLKKAIPLRGKNNSKHR